MATIKMSIIINAGEGVEKRNPPPPRQWLVGMHTCAAAMENSIEVPQKTKNKGCHKVQRSHSWETGTKL